MRVLFAVPHPIEGPSSRFRVYQFIDDLRDRGIDAEVRPFLSSRAAPLIYENGRLIDKAAVTGWATAKRLVDVLRATRYDVAYVLREAFPFGPPCFEAALKAAAGRLVFDFDDAIYRPALAFDNPLDRLRDFNKPAKIIRMSNHVVVGSAYLADYAAQFAESRERITVLPTVVDTDVYRPSPEPKPPHLTIGWIGTPRGSCYLEDLKNMARRLAQRYAHVRFKYVGAEAFECGNLPITFKQWRLEEEVADLQSFDIGIMPLTDDEETRGKCGFKLIQYMSVGIPAVCSPVGANLSIVEEGTTGYFARDEDEWFAALDRLVADAGLRKRLGENGRALAVGSYSRAAIAPRLIDVLERAAR